MAKKKKPLKKVPSNYELMRQIRGEAMPSPKTILSKKDKMKSSRAYKKSQWRKEDLE